MRKLPLHRITLECIDCRWYFFFYWENVYWVVIHKKINYVKQSTVLFKSKVKSKIKELVP